MLHPPKRISTAKENPGTPNTTRAFARSQGGSGLLSGQDAVYLLLVKGFSTTGAARFEAGFPSAVAGSNMMGHSMGPCGTPQHPFHTPALGLLSLRSTVLQQNHFSWTANEGTLLLFVHQNVATEVQNFNFLERYL